MEMLVVKSKIREVAGDVNVGGDVADRLNEMAHQLADMAAKRAEANGRKTVQARDVLIIDEPMYDDVLVVKSKIKDALSGDYNMGADFPKALSEVLVWTVKQAALRAKANGRKTLQARDI